MYSFDLTIIKESFLLFDYAWQAISALVEPINYLFDPSKRIFIPFLISNFLFALCALAIKKSAIWSIITTSFSKKYWFSKTSYVDVQWLFFNQLFRFFIVIPLLITQLSLAMVCYRFLYRTFGSGDFLQIPQSQVLILYTLVLFVFNDFSRFFVHFLYHRIPCLWRFHAIHHSANRLTPITLYRTHFVEYFINSCRSVFVSGVIGGVFIYCFDGKITVLEVLGVNLLNFLFNLAGANLRHSHIFLGFGKFEHFFISPAQHQVHHSSELRHLDKNFGVGLACWDKLFGSWQASKNNKPKRFGLFKQQAPQSFFKQFFGLK